jgi:predicted ATPase
MKSPRAITRAALHRDQLEPLTEEQARELVANLLHIEDLPERVRALILRKAEGNPFFVEEVIRSLLDARLVVRENCTGARRARSKTSPCPIHWPG